MVAFVVRRLLHAIAVMVIAVALGFSLVHVTPGDALTGDVTRRGRAAELRAQRRAKLGLDQPISTQFMHFAGAALHGDFGHSLIDDQPVSSVLGTALRNSLQLTGAGLLAAIALGLIVGSVEGWRPDWTAFRMLGGALTALYAVPEFVLAITLIGALSYAAAWFPIGGMNDPVTGVIGSTSERWFDALWHLCLPAMTLALGWGAAVARQQRVATAETAGQDFVRTARAKGRSDRATLVRHALPTTVTPLITVIGLMLPAMVGGSVIVEVVFAWPGLGSQVVRAVAQRDVPVVSGAIVLVSLLVAISSLMIDVIIRLTDPRQRTERTDNA